MVKLSAELQRYFLDAPTATDNSPLEVQVSKNVTLKELLTLGGEHSFGFLFVLLSLPSALPLPAPVISTPLGIVIIVLAFQLIRGKRKPSLPEKWLERGFERGKVRNFIKIGLPWLRRIEAISKPRLSIVCKSTLGRFLLGVIVALLAACMMIPFPGTNTIPAICIFIIGFGLLNDDGLIGLIGLTACALGASLVTKALILGCQEVAYCRNIFFDGDAERVTSALGIHTPLHLSRGDL